jgi:6-phosphogluconolactonase
MTDRLRVGGVEVVVCDDAEAAARAAAEELARAAREGVHVALAGGSTPRRAYELAAELEPDWSGAEIWFGDERCVPPDDERSNFRLVREALLDRAPHPPRAVHRIDCEAGAEDAARRYDADLRNVTLGLVLLGIGRDGHTASLFPRAPALRERDRRAVAVQRADVERVTLTLPALSAAQTVVFLAVGPDKAEAVARAFASRASEETPASLVRGVRQTLSIADAASAQGLHSVRA